MAGLALSAGQSGEAERLYRQDLAIAEELADAEPANTGFRRDLSVSYDQLADLALAAGQSGEAERLYRQGLAIAEELADAEPANTDSRSDLSIFYERLADLARLADQKAKAKIYIATALGVRSHLNGAEPTRLDRAEDFAYAHYLSTLIDPSTAQPSKATAMAVLAPFEAAGQLTTRAEALLNWARS